MALKEDNLVMINPPDGFDARNWTITKLFFPGILPKLVPSSNWINNVWSALPKKAAVSKPQSELRFFMLGESITMRFSSTKELSSKSACVDQPLSIYKKLSLIQSTAGESTTAKQDTIVTLQDLNMVLNCNPETL